ncbi:siderophore-interacting protein [Verticiella sediminum]|uniref:Siderophore-interacting protein n=1 Tax=Verticiella sediminum TaxID=1247510 RepID=A0A556AZT5_9BURK|nr:siderophore-interacting protein [Verticiella sediminum]TSH97975.1 siderophore-interacting protein [Verticiella sediminum]
MTLPTTERRVQRVRHPLKFRLVRVLRVNDIAPRIRRITFTGDDLADFVSASFDDHVKLFFPLPGQSRPALPTATPDGIVFADDVPRPPARDYTPQRVDTRARELDIDFVLHGEGPATTWAAQAEVGQYLGVGGPRGSFIIPADYPWHLLIGDETALPAIGRRLRELPAETRAIAVVAIDDVHDEIALDSPARTAVHWVHRQGSQARSLDDAIAALSLPPGAGYVWIAAEAAQAKALRALVVERFGVDKANLRASAYWKQGASNVHETLEG